MYVYLWLIHVEVWQKQQNSVKQLSFNKKNKLILKRIKPDYSWPYIVGLRTDSSKHPWNKWNDWNDTQMWNKCSQILDFINSRFNNEFIFKVIE